MRLVFSILFVIGLTGTPEAAELLFSHSENGNPQGGSIDKLVEAVRKGTAIRIVYAKGGVLWQRPCLHVSAMGDAGDDVVSCIITAIPDTLDAPADEGRVLAQPTAFETNIFNTSGLRDERKLDATGNQLSAGQSRIALSWYGD